MFEMPLNESYTAIVQLHEALEAAGIRHSFERMYDGYQIFCAIRGSKSRLSIVQHHISYGASYNLLETARVSNCDHVYDVHGYLEKDEVLRQITSIQKGEA